MRIVYLSNSAIPSKSANSIHVMNMCEALTHIGHNVVLICRLGEYPLIKLIKKYYNIKENFRLKYFTWPSIPGAGVLYGIQVGWYLKNRRQNIDLIYARCPYSSLIAVLLGLPIIFEAHALPRTRFHQWMESVILKSKHLLKFVIISNVLKKDYEQINPWLKNSVPMIVVHDAASININETLVNFQFTNESVNTQKGFLDENKNRMSGTHNSNSVRLRIVYTGSLLLGKGIEIIVALALRLPQYEFHIIGGPNKLWPLYKGEKQFENLIFHGFQPPYIARQWQRNSDILLLPNQYNVMTNIGRVDIGKWTSPLKLFEYMASKAPIIASDLPVLQEVLSDGENALLVEPQSIDAWTDAINALASNHQLRKSLAIQAYHDLSENYTWIKRARRILE